MKSPDPILSHLAAEGYDLDLRNPVIDVEKTLRKLKRAGVEVSRLSLPSGILGRRRKLARICEERGISPVWCD